MVTICPQHCHSARDTAFNNLLRHRNKKTGRYDFDVADYAAHVFAKLSRTRS